jgi:DNA-binding NtrC family response regulator
MTKNSEPFRILIVDDDREIGTILVDYLREQGYDAQGAGGGKEAIERHGDVPFDLIVTDLAMPGMTGIELIKKLAADGNTTEFIIITGYASLDNAIEAVKAGAFDYILKPFRIEELGVVIKNAQDKIMLKKANKYLLDKLKSFYSEVSRYKKWLGDEEMAHLMQEPSDP